MQPGSSASDLAQVLQRLVRLEAQVTEQQQIIAEQQALIIEQRATITTLRATLTTAQEQITLLKKALFAPRRERHLAADQKLLFDTVAIEPSVPPAPPARVETSPPQARRRPRQKFIFPDFLPVVREEHKLDDAQCACGNCGQQRVVIKTLVTRQIEIERAKAYIAEQVRYTYACAECRDGSQLHTTAKPPAPLEKSPFGASVLAWVIAAKFERHLPTYRQQEMLLAPLGLWLSRPLLVHLLQGSARVLQPLVQCALRQLLQSDVIQVDETPVHYLGGEAGKSSTGYLFGYAGDAEHRFLCYDYRSTRSRAGPAEILADYQGVLLTDGFSGYEALVRESPGRLRAAACWMHARREFDEARATTSHPLVEESLATIRQLYDVEDRARPLAHQDRHALRERESRPLVETFFARLANVEPLRPSSPLAKAAQYSLNRRAALSRFLDDGRIELDTGLLERSLRGPALGRKNYLFFGSLGGGRTAATLYSVVQSARLYQLDVTAYLTDLLRRLPALSPQDDAALRELLPDHWALAHPQHVLQARQQESRTALEHRRQRRAQRRLQTSV